MVPESRGGALRLARDALASAPRRARVLELRAGVAARALDRERGRPVRPPPAGARDADRGNRAHGAARGADVGRARAGLGGDALRGRAGRDDGVRDPGVVLADRRPRPARGSRLGGRAQLDDVQPRARRRPGARGDRGAAARDRSVVRDQLRFVSRARRRRPRRPPGGAPGRHACRVPAPRQPEGGRRTARSARVVADRGCGRLRVGSGEHRGAGVRARVRKAGHVRGVHHLRLRGGRGCGRVPHGRPGDRDAPADGADARAARLRPRRVLPRAAVSGRRSASSSSPASAISHRTRRPRAVFSSASRSTCGAG